ncbi:MAG: MoaD/ThiS family protein [Planctomycetota bacterium]
MRVRLFGPLRQSVGGGFLEVPDTLRSVKELEDHLILAHPSLAQHKPYWRVALDLEYATSDASLAGVKEAALIPPVSGG